MCGCKARDSHTMVLLSKQAFTPKPTRAATPDLRPLIQSRQGKPLRTRKALRRQARQNDAADDAQIQCLPALRCHSAQNEQGAGSAANTGALTMLLFPRLDSACSGPDAFKHSQDSHCNIRCHKLLGSCLVLHVGSLLLQQLLPS